MRTLTAFAVLSPKGSLFRIVWADTARAACVACMNDEQAESGEFKAYAMRGEDDQLFVDDVPLAEMDAETLRSLERIVELDAILAADDADAADLADVRAERIALVDETIWITDPETVEDELQDLLNAYGLQEGVR